MQQIKTIYNGQLRVTFKDVGQGDSIIVEWLKKGKLQVGIIDCKFGKKDNNVIVEHIETLRNFDLEFLILTHPHKDHFEAAAKLLDHLGSKGSKLKRLCTPFHFDFNFIENYTERESKLIDEFVEASKRFKRKKNPKVMGVDRVMTAGAEVKIDFRGFKIHCYAPRGEDAKHFQRALKKEAQADFTTGSVAANAIATIVIIESDTKFVLLTSDAQAPAFNSMIRETVSTRKKKLCLIQVPQHGSKKNFVPFAWKRFRKVSACPAVISAGENKYNHPSVPVLRKIKKLGYQLRLTNVVDGVRTFLMKLSKDERRKVICAGEISLKNKTPVVGRDVVELIDNFF